MSVYLTFPDSSFSPFLKWQSLKHDKDKLIHIAGKLNFSDETLKQELTERNSYQYSKWSLL